MEPERKETLLVLELKPLVPYKTKDEYMYAMKEDLAEWFTCLYKITIDVENFFEFLDTGVILCEHANKVRVFANERDKKGLNGGVQSNFVKGLQIPQYEVQYKINVKPQSFQARDNISNFITWTRNLGIPEVLSFETDDLVLRKNEKSVILCLLEVARVGAKLGMLAPTIVRMEEEIDAEIAGEPPPQIKTCDLKSLDEMILRMKYFIWCRIWAGRCTCPVQFAIIKVGEGKYKIGESQTLVFVRILRNHVMIRVGGGWDTLEHYLDKHDPCRCNFTGHRTNSLKSAPRRSSTPTVTQSQPLSTKSPRKMSAAPNLTQINQRPPSPARMRSLSPPGPSPRNSTSQLNTNSDQVKRKNNNENESVNERVRTLSSRSQSPVPGRYRSPSPSPAFTKSDKVAEQVVHNNRPSSPIKQRRLSENVTVKRCTSPSPANYKRCVSESPAPVRKFGNSQPQRCGSVSPAPVRKSGLSTVRAVNSVDKSRQLSKSQGNMDAADSQDGVTMDTISTMTLDEFKNLLNNALSVPNGDTSEGSSPRSQSSTDSYKPHSQTPKSRGSKKPASSGGLLNKTWTTRKELSKSFDTGDVKTEKSWRSYTTREMTKTPVEKNENSVTIPRPKTPVSLSKTKPSVTSYKPALGPKPAVSSVKQNSSVVSASIPRQSVNLNNSRPKTPTSLFNSSVHTGNQVKDTPGARKIGASSQHSLTSPLSSTMSSPLSPSNSVFSAKLESALQNGPRTPESQRSILSPSSDTNSGWKKSETNSGWAKTDSSSELNKSASSSEWNKLESSSGYKSESSSGYKSDSSSRWNKSATSSGVTKPDSGYRWNKSDAVSVLSKYDAKDANKTISSTSSSSPSISDSSNSRPLNSTYGGSNGIIQPKETARPNVCYVTIKKGERNGQSFLAHINTEESRSIDYDDNQRYSSLNEDLPKQRGYSDPSSVNSTTLGTNNISRAQSDSVLQTKEDSSINANFNRKVENDYKSDKTENSVERNRKVSGEKISESEGVPPRPSTPSLIPRPSTPSLIPRPSTPSSIPRPSTPVSTATETKTKPQRQLPDPDKASGRPPTPRKATIIAKSPSAAKNSQVNSQSGSYSSIYMNRRAITPGPRDINLVTAGETPRENIRRAVTPGPNEKYNRPSTPKLTTSRSYSKSGNDKERENSLNSSKSIEFSAKEIPLSDYNQSGNMRKNSGVSESRTVPSSPAIERRRSSANSGDSKSLKRQQALDEDTVITVNRSGGQHAISVKEGNEVKYKSGKATGARIMARSPSASQNRNANIEKLKNRSRSLDVAQERQRPKSVEPQSFYGRRSSCGQGEEVLTVVRTQNGGHAVANRTEAWVASTAQTPKKSVHSRPRSKTPSLNHMNESELESRPLEEIKAALTLPINGLKLPDPVELEAPPEDPEAYAKMQALFEALREKELKTSVNESPGGSELMPDLDLDCMENEDELCNYASLDMNENKRRPSSGSRGSSMKASPSSSNRGSVPSTPIRCKTPTLSRSSSSSQPIARPVSTPPRPSTPTRLSRKSSPKLSSGSSQERNCKTPTDHANVLVTKIKQILNTNPRRDDKDGPRSRIPAPKSLTNASRSRSFSNLSSASDNDQLSNQQSLDGGYYMNGNSNGDPFDEELAMINSRTPRNDSNDNNRSQSKTPVPKLSNPLTTGRRSFLNNGRENTRTPKLVRAVSSDMLSSLSSSSQTLHTLDDEEYV